MAEPYGTIAKYKKMGQIEKHNEQVRAWAAPMALDVAAIFWATWRGIEKRLPKGEIETDEEKFHALMQINRIADEEVTKQTPNLWACLAEYERKVFLAGAVEQCRRMNDYSFLSTREPFNEAFTPDVNIVESETLTLTVGTDDDGWVSVPNQRAVNYATEHAAEMVTEIDETTRSEINQIIVNATDTGTSYTDIADLIKAKFEEFSTPMPQQHISNRATLVAVTELANAYCEGNNEVGQHLEDAGLDMMKIWSTCEDDRVSEGCKANQAAGWIRFDETFPSGDVHPPRFPGCRCDMLQDMLEEAALGKSYDEFVDMDFDDEVAAKSTGEYESAGEYESEKELYKDEKAKAEGLISKEMQELWKECGGSWATFSDNILKLLNDQYGDEFKGLTLADALDLAGEKGYIPQNDVDAIRMLNSYTGTNGASILNKYLREAAAGKAIDPEEWNGGSKAIKGMDKTIEAMDRLISQQSLNKGIEATRYYTGDLPSSLKEQITNVGGTYTTDQYMSTTLKETHQFKKDAKGIAHITVPAGSERGIYAQAYADILPSNYTVGEDLKTKGKQREEEFIIARGSEFTVDKVITKKNGWEVWLTLKD